MDDDDSRVRIVVRADATPECDDGTGADRDSVIRPRGVVELLHMTHRSRLAQLERADDKVDRPIDRRQRHSDVAVHLLLALGVRPILLALQLQQATSSDQKKINLC